jgi:SAM-dependent methyltransferase
MSSVWQGQAEQKSSGRFYNKALADLVKPYLGKRILELGVGIGNIAEFTIVGAEIYYGVDADKEHVQHAIWRMHAFPFQGLVMDLCELDSLEDLSALDFDTIVSVNVVEHWPNDQEVMKRLVSISKPGTKFAFIVPAYQRLYNYLDAQGGHYRRYNRITFRNLLESSGISINGLRYFNTIGAAAWFVGGLCARGDAHTPPDPKSMTKPWQALYAGMRIARYPLGLILSLERKFWSPFGLSLVAWGIKN